MKFLQNWLRENWNSLLTAAMLNYLLFFLLTAIPQGWIAFALLLTTFFLRGPQVPIVEIIIGVLQTLAVGSGIVINCLSGRISINEAIVITIGALVILTVRVVPVLLKVLKPLEDEK